MCGLWHFPWFFASCLEKHPHSTRTLCQTNMEPQKAWFIDDRPFSKAPFQVPCSFGECTLGSCNSELFCLISLCTVCHCGSSKGFKVSSGTAEGYRTSHGTHLDVSEISHFLKYQTPNKSTQKNGPKAHSKSPKRVDVALAVELPKRRRRDGLGLHGRRPYSALHNYIGLYVYIYIYVYMYI